ncbi:MAG: hypothetical protein HND59_05115 [Pseudomonadota bacterium]|nr:MAG: hypothetical protein HND59_05115 [Pseudomonadota bacterium]
MKLRLYGAVIPILFSINASAAGANPDLKAVTKKPTKAPSVMAITQKPATTASEQPANSEQIPKNPGIRLPAVQGPGSATGPGRLDNPALRKLPENNAARGLGSAKDAIPQVPGAPARQGNITDIPGSTLGRNSKGGTDWNKLPGQQNSKGFENPLGRYAPDLPDNNRGRGKNPLVPSANPKDWASGAASQGGMTRHDEGGTIYYTGRKSDGQGGTVDTRSTYDAETGEFISSSRTHTRADGSSTSTLLVRTAGTHDVRSGQSGAIVQETQETRDASGRVSSTYTHPGRELGGDKTDPPVRDPQFDRTIDPDSDSGQGNRHAVLYHAMEMPDRWR